MVFPALPILIFFLSTQNSVSSSTRALVLPLKTQKLPQGSVRAFSDKIAINHKVALTVSLTAGSPQQNITMVVDTGSELPWLRCNKSSANSASVFDPFASSSYSPIPCSSPTCQIRARDLPIPVSCNPENLCHAIVSYADASYSEGTLASETFRVGASVQPGIVFGCMLSGFSSRTVEDSETTGLMGMNLGSLSIVKQMGLPKFSFCVSGIDSYGVLILRDENSGSTRDLKYTPLVQISTRLPSFDRFAYSVELEGIKVSSRLLPLPKSVFLPDHTGAGQTMIDSGTQFSFLLGPVYAALKTEFVEQTKGILTLLNDPSFVFEGTMDLCFRVPLTWTSLPKLPPVSFMFKGAEMTVAGEKLVYKVPEVVRGSDSVHCFTFGNSDLLGVEAFVIGHHHQQDTWIEYDLAESRIGFASVNCKLASTRVGLGL